MLQRNYRHLRNNGTNHPYKADPSHLVHEANLFNKYGRKVASFRTEKRYGFNAEELLAAIAWYERTFAKEIKAEDRFYQ